MSQIKVVKNRSIDWLVDWVTTNSKVLKLAYCGVMSQWKVEKSNWDWNSKMLVDISTSDLGSTILVDLTSGHISCLVDASIECNSSVVDMLSCTVSGDT